MNIQGNLKLYEAKDASINVTINYDFRRFLLGIAGTSGNLKGVVSMRMFVMHIAFFSLCLTSFGQVEVHMTPPPPKPEMHRSPTRQYRKGRRK